jgi:hypothetical protein
MVANLSLTFAAVNRWSARRNNIPAASHAGQLLDRHYNDARMERLFPNMVFADEWKGAYK